MPGIHAPIGVFDSGIGGLSILRALRLALPHEDYVYHADTGHAPYGERGDAFVIERSMAQASDMIDRRGVKLLVVACNTATAAAIEALRATWPRVPIVGVEPALKPAASGTRTGRVGVLATRGTLAIARELVESHGVKLLVVACNTATAAAVAALRAAWPQVPIVGVEPALKPAASLSRTRRVGVLATRGTLASEKFAQLHASLAGQAEFILQPCDGLAAAIERGERAQAGALLATYLGALGPLGWAPGEVDTVVLGCTHYALVMDQVQQLAGPRVRVLETGEPVARHTRHLLEEAGLLAPPGAAGRVHLRTSGSPAMAAALEAAAARWLG